MNEVVVGSLKYDDRPVNTEHPLFEAIWQAIKGWDVSRYNDGLYSGASGTDVQIIIDSIEASQPQPVAQGEAVAWQRRDRIPHGGGDAPGWSHWREVGRYEFAEHNGKYSHIEFRELYATPPIPTGHRAVPVEPDEEFIQMLRGRAQFLRDRGEVKSPSLLEWAANLLAASPSAGGV